MQDTQQATYWQQRYQNQEIGWDIGYPSTPIKTYIEQLQQKNIRILIPGCGNAYEGELLHQQGFSNTYLLDWSELALQNLRVRMPQIPQANLICQNFFEHDASYDLIIEQTFFCALPIEKRSLYVKHVHKILREGGKLVGLLFNREFGATGPPFGGTIDLYKTLFDPYFIFQTIEPAYNSIAPRAGAECFFIAQKR